MQKQFIKILINSSGILLILIILFLFLSHDSGEPIWKGQIKIGLIAPLTGSVQSGGISMQRGAELAVKNINDNGGIGGYQLQLVTIDDHATPKITERAVKELVFIENVEAIIGPFNSDCALAIKGLINNCGIPLITPVAMSDALNQEDDFIFRNTLGVTNAQIKVNAYSDFQNKKYLLLEGLGAKNLGIYWQNDIWGYEMQKRIADDLNAINKEDALLFSEPFQSGQTDFESLFTALEGNYPDLIYVVSAGDESIDLVRSARKAGYAGLFLGEGGFNYSNFDKELKAYADGCFFSTQWHPSFSTPMSDVFLKSYMAEYDEIPNMFAALTYESLYILKGSMLRTLLYIWRDNYKSLLRDDLATPRTIDGITGKIYFDSTGQCDRTVFVMQKKWDGRRIQSLILYPTEYSQGNYEWDWIVEQ
ncbi:ABC transporter substrate-binding protein [Bacillota bacterium]